MSENKIIFRLGELFCGSGGLTLGITTARINNPDYKILHGVSVASLSSNLLIYKAFYVVTFN